MPPKASKRRAVAPARRKGERRRVKAPRRKGERRRLQVDPSQIVYIDDKGIHVGLPERRTGKERRRARGRRDGS